MRHRLCSCPSFYRPAFLLSIASVFCFAGAYSAQELPQRTTPEAKSGLTSFVGSKVCATCHAEIYRKFVGTTMAKTSGRANRAIIPGEFLHKPSKVHYRIYEENGRAWLSFDRAKDRPLQGKRELLYFIGSGHRGRTYLYYEDGFVFEAPINWYGQGNSWDMTPAYKETMEIPLSLPASASCLHCHTSSFRIPVEGTENKYVLPLFAEDGVACERCHGPGRAHSEKNGPIVNPAKLPAARRDEVCMQCHLEGDVAIEQNAKHLYDYIPGDELSNYVHYLLLKRAGASNPRAVSHFEALVQSECRKKTGDSMTCTTCHDPHDSPSAELRVSYYRSRCLGCHGEGFGNRHHAKNPDCTSCHMPRLLSGDVAHTQTTDHRMLSNVKSSAANEGLRTKTQLVRFPPEAGGANNRDLVLGWLALAKTGKDFALPEEQKLLAKTAEEYPDDAAILSAYAYEELRNKRTVHAKELFQTALKSDPLNVDAAVNLGVIEVQAGHAARALSLWKSAFERAPWHPAIGLNIAQLFCDLGRAEDAKAYVRRVLQYNPDHSQANFLLHQLQSQATPCSSP